MFREINKGVCVLGWLLLVVSVPAHDHLSKDFPGARGWHSSPRVGKSFFGDVSRVLCLPGCSWLELVFLVAPYSASARGPASRFGLVGGCRRGGGEWWFCVCCMAFVG